MGATRSYAPVAQEVANDREMEEVVAHTPVHAATDDAHTPGSKKSDD